MARDVAKAEYLTMVMALFYRAKTTYEASLLLCREGYGDRALMLCRSLFEDMVDAHWVHATPEEALERYSDHARLTNLQRVETLTKYEGLLRERLPAELSRAAEATSEEQRARLRRIYGRFGTRSWTGVSLPSTGRGDRAGLGI
ncbi:MAG: DUF5677 domain-containing protein [Actinomycetota bacterium]|nr:DUF5677 domain-containing protein [Actinomycetota bacterium]